MPTQAAPTMMGTLAIAGLRCPGRHGVYPEEQTAERTFLVDLELRTDLGPAAQSDALDDALDIAALAQAAREVVAGPPRALLERLAWDLARTLLERFPSIEQAQVRVRKPDPPGLDAEHEAVTLQLARR